MEMLDMLQCYTAVARYAIESQRKRKTDHWSMHSVEHLKQHRTIHLDFGRCTLKTRAAIEIAQEHNGILITLNSAFAKWLKRDLVGKDIDKTRITYSKAAVAEIRENGYDVVVIDEPALHKEANMVAIYNACVEKQIKNIILIGR